MKKVMVIAITILILVGCNSNTKNTNKETGLVCENETVSSITTKYEVELDENNTNKMTKIVRTYIATIPEVNFENRTTEEVEELFKAQYINPNDILEGVDFDISLDENSKEITVIATIDVAKADMKKVAKKLEMLNVTKADTFKADLEDKGYVCKKAK